MKEKIYCPACGEPMKYFDFTDEYTRACWPDDLPVDELYCFMLIPGPYRGDNGEIVCGMYYCPECLIAYIIA